jgi:hypothetical protein
MIQLQTFLPATEPAMSKLQKFIGIVAAFLVVVFASIEYRGNIIPGLRGLLSVHAVSLTGSPALYEGIPVKDINWE